MFIKQAHHNKARMEVQPRIETLSQRKLIGKRLKMTLAKDQTFKLWQSFMPRRKVFCFLSTLVQLDTEVLLIGHNLNPKPLTVTCN